MICATCGNTAAYAKRIVDETETCDQCGGFAAVAPIHDVYFRHPYRSEALDVEFTSPAQKARVMKEMDISEAGDTSQSNITWVEGTRAWRKARFEKERPLLRKIYRDWKENAKH